ncbi:MAG: chloride channel protein [Rhodospirillales bacterium]|nr:chloride channel protein [Rhodospirillales bacterium]
MASERITISRVLMRARRVLRNDQLILAVLAVFVGACSGGAIIVFREGISQVQSVFYGTGSERLYEHVATLPWWWVLLAPTVGGLLVGLLFQYFLRRKRASTVADVIAATALRSGRMSLRRGLKTAIIDCLSIGVGASVGREGPAVHLGASLGGYLAKVLHLTRSLSRTLMGCGVAAAVAASFNAPIAGALFANEVIIGHYGLSAFAPIVISSVVGTMVSHAYFGDFPAFIITQHVGVSFVEMPAFAILGLLAAFSAIGVMYGVTAAGKVSAKVPGPVWLRPGVGGFLVGGIAIFIPHVLGLGYGVTDDALKEALPWAILLAAFIGKLVATTISIGFGFGGGIFSAALCIGAMLGGVYGVAVTNVFHGLSSGADIYTVVGMGAVAAAILGAPISTTLIIFEMTSDYGLTVAVMVAVVISSIVTKQITGHSFFTWQLARRGLDLRSGFESALLRDLRVRDVMVIECARIGPEVRLPEIRKLLPGAPGGEIFVVDDDDALVGTITLSDLAGFAFDEDVDDLVTASDVARLHPHVIAITDDLEHAMEVFSNCGEQRIAVVDSIDSLIFHGCVHERDVFAAYNRALVENRREEHE